MRLARKLKEKVQGDVVRVCVDQGGFLRLVRVSQAWLCCTSGHAWETRTAEQDTQMAVRKAPGCAGRGNERGKRK